MHRATRKHLTFPTEPPSDAGFERPGSNMLHTHEAAGLSPAPPTSPHVERFSNFQPPQKASRKHVLSPINAVKAFLLSRRVANCSRHTLAVRARNPWPLRADSGHGAGRVHVVGRAAVS